MQHTYTPVTGVYSGNDIDWQEFNAWINPQEEAMRMRYEDMGLDEDEVQVLMDYKTQYGWEADDTIQLYGDWILNDEGLYEPNPNGQVAVIYDSNMNVAQVVHSQTTRYGRWASPCYPHQADARTDDPDEPSEYLDVLYYALPQWAIRPGL